MDPRFISLFSVFNVTFPSQESLTKIYHSILNGHLEPFKKEVKDLASKITASTLELYQKIIQNLPPTPSKFHYIFNLRDLSRVTQGLCLSTPDRFENPGQFVRLWRNECLRVFYDRLISASDKQIVSVSLAEFSRFFDGFVYHMLMFSVSCKSKHAQPHLFRLHVVVFLGETSLLPQKFLFPRLMASIVRLYLILITNSPKPIKMRAFLPHKR